MYMTHMCYAFKRQVKAIAAKNLVQTILGLTSPQMQAGRRRRLQGELVIKVNLHCIQELEA